MTVNPESFTTKRLQNLALDHLTVDGHPLRKQCLADLVERGAFHYYPNVLPETIRAVIRKYLIDNPRNFCADGIERFKKAIYLDQSSKRKMLTVTFQLEVDNNYSAWGSTMDGGLVNRLQHHLLKYSGNGDKIVGVHYVDYNCTTK